MVVGNPTRLSTSFLTVAAGAIAVVVFSGFLAWILPELKPLATNSEITGRTSPALIDLVAAVATGFAGAYGLARKDVSDVMPGAAIAISLVPPLSVVGITAAAGEWSDAWGASLLFSSNVVSMIVAGTIMFTLYGYHREAMASPGFRKKRAYAVIGISLLLITVPLTVTTVRTVLGHLWQSRASSVAEGWAEDHGYQRLKVEYQGPDLVVVIEGTGATPPSDELLERLRGEVPGGTPVVVNAVTGGRSAVGKVPDEQSP